MCDVSTTYSVDNCDRHCGHQDRVVLVPCSSTTACSPSRAQVGGLHVYFCTSRTVQHDDIPSSDVVEAVTPPSAPVQGGRGGERVQLHTRAGRVERPQVGGLHSHRACSVCEGDRAPAFGAVILATPPGEPVRRGGRERVQLHGRAGRVEFGDKRVRHLIPVHGVCVVVVKTLTCHVWTT